MMNSNEINGFHIELTNMCTLKCPGCARTRFIEQWPQHWKNQNLDLNDFSNFFDISLEDKIFNLCGNYGDPIYHPHMIKFVKMLKDKGAVINITTNGSYKTTDWWKKLVELLDHRDSITFSVDGTPDNFTNYRINGDWESILSGMKTVAKATCDSNWKYLVFAYNEHDIESARKLCKTIGIKNFQLDRSERFDNQTEDFIPINIEFLGERYEKQQDFKNNKYSNLDPKCKKNNKEHFITAHGFYSPCCYVADHRFYYKTIFGKNKKQYSIKNNTITELLQKPEIVQFYKNLQNTSACLYNCPLL